MAEIDGVVAQFDGEARHTAEGLELVFSARDGLRHALDELVGKELQCCETLALTIQEQMGKVLLRIAARESDRAAIQAFAARLNRARTARNGLRERR